jgi:hypothetical protein
MVSGAHQTGADSMKRRESAVIMVDKNSKPKPDPKSVGNMEMTYAGWMAGCFILESRDTGGQQ